MFNVCFKYLIYDPHKSYEDKPNIYSYRANQKFKWRSLVPAIAVMSGINIDSKMNPYTSNGINGVSPFILIATQNNFKNNTVLVTNIVLDRTGSNQSDFEYIVTVTKAININWAIFIETQGIKSDFYADNLFRAGAGYLFSKNLQLDSTLCLNTKDTPSLLNINFGISYRLDRHDIIN